MINHLKNKEEPKPKLPEFKVISNKDLLKETLLLISVLLLKKIRKMKKNSNPN